MTTSANRFRFRAWDGHYKKWIKGFYLTPDGKIFEEDFEHGPETTSYFLSEVLYSKKAVLMQSTGMADRLGNEIWEGDLLQDETHDKPVVEVRWWPEAMRFQCFRGESPWEVYFDGAWPRRLMAQVVIGNKFEHPELLERKG